MNNKGINRKCVLVAALLTAFIEELTAIVWNVLPIFDDTCLDSDLIYYVAAVIIGTVSFGAIYLIGYNKIKDGDENKQREKKLETAGLAFMGLIVFGVFACERDVYASYWVNIPWRDSIIFAILMTMVVCVIAYYSRGVAKNGYSAGRVKLKPLYCLLALMSAMSLYLPNWHINYIRFHHVNSYFNSIYFVMEGQPYSSINRCIYGHYGILLAPFVKLLGGDTTACTIVLAALTGISVLLYLYVMDYFVENTVIKVLAAICISAYALGSYADMTYQGLPHRTIFPAIVMSLMVLRYKNKKISGRLYRLLGWIISSLSILWNLETGVGCLLAFVGGNIAEILLKNDLKAPSVWVKAAKELLFIPAAFITAVAVVDVYNLAVGGEILSIAEFLFPMVGVDYVGAIKLSLPMNLSPWMLILLLFLQIIAFALLNIFHSGTSGEKDKTVCAAGAVICCGVLMTYYINRSAYINLYITLPLCAALMGFLIDNGRKNHIWDSDAYGSGILRADAQLKAAILAVIAFVTIGRFFMVENERSDRRDMTLINAVIRNVERAVPEGTLGVDAAEIYSCLGRSTGYYGIDMSDYYSASPEGREYVEDLVMKSESIFISKRALEEIDAYYSGNYIKEFNRSHKIESEFYTDYMEYAYYISK